MKVVPREMGSKDEKLKENPSGLWYWQCHGFRH
jgi:hypothetical protein